MKAEDLRVGNFVKHRNTELQICQIFVDSFQGMYVGGKGSYTYANSDPIPLTEEWLLKFGFHDRSGTMKNRLGYGIDINTMIEIAWYKLGNDVRLQSKGSGWTFNTKILYVHQLQNLYHSLTGEELTIKNT